MIKPKSRPDRNNLARSSPCLLRIATAGIDDVSGHAIARLLPWGQNVRPFDHLDVRADIKDGETVLAFPALAPGSQAIAMFHEFNNTNGASSQPTAIWMEAQ